MSHCVSHRCAAWNNASNAMEPTCETLFLLSYLPLLCLIKELTTSPSTVLCVTEVIVHLLPSQPQLTWYKCFHRKLVNSYKISYLSVQNLNNFNDFLKWTNNLFNTKRQVTFAGSSAKVRRHKFCWPVKVTLNFCCKIKALVC